MKTSTTSDKALQRLAGLRGYLSSQGYTPEQMAQLIDQGFWGAVQRRAVKIAPELHREVIINKKVSC